MTNKKNTVVRCMLILVLAVIHNAVVAQPHNTAIKSKAQVDSILLSENLQKLSGTPTTFYSAGFEVRSNTLQKLFGDCIHFYEGIFPDPALSPNVFILNKPDWQKPNFDEPYGMPFYDPDYEILVVAAEKDALAKLTGLKNFPKTSDTVLSGLDYQPVHELGHYFFFTVYKINKEKWLNEFLATYFLICYLKEKGLEPNLENELRAEYPVDHKTLDEFQKLYLGVGPKNYHWYQSKFASLGFRLYPQLKTSLISKVIDNYKSGGSNLDGVSLLRTLAPDTFNAWLKEMH